jgi:hypothetical protein
MISIIDGIMYNENHHMTPSGDGTLYGGGKYISREKNQSISIAVISQSPPISKIM